MRSVNVTGTFVNKYIKKKYGNLSAFKCYLIFRTHVQDIIVLIWFHFVSHSSYLSFLIFFNAYEHHQWWNQVYSWRASTPMTSLLYSSIDWCEIYSIRSFILIFPGYFSIMKKVIWFMFQAVDTSATKLQYGTPFNPQTPNTRRD